MILEIYCDGGSRGNPGLGGAGIKFKIQNSMPHRQVAEEATKFRIRTREVGLYLGPNITNNQAEYLAVIAALKMIMRYQREEEIEMVRVYLDSELVVRQLKGEYKVKNELLKELYRRVKSLVGQVPMVEFKYVPREENQEADELVNLVLDLAEAISAER